MTWHDLTQKELPLPQEKYEQTAKDLSEAITTAQDNSGDKSLWAADRTLLDILIDECVKQKINQKINRKKLRFHEVPVTPLHPTTTSIHPIPLLNRSTYLPPHFGPLYPTTLAHMTPAHLRSNVPFDNSLVINSACGYRKEYCVYYVKISGNV
jgi:hypothetical protein